ncbi:MAG: Asp-tRNA(Asn)/Glu-tRNA(Gln) amidotransferase subunit GatC [Minisyncoccia bacterium]|jgi:aspartyl-tRNA(Asn)/glutamyl-tRNA(Gln) amidotransferase subunit C
MLTKKDLEKLAELSRMELNGKEEEKLLKDLGKILDYFEKLKEVNTEGVSPMTGGTESENVLREDGGSSNIDKNKAIEAFPENSGGFLRVPPVF